MLNQTYIFMKLNHYQDCTSIEYEQVSYYVYAVWWGEIERERENGVLSRLDGLSLQGPTVQSIRY